MRLPKIKEKISIDFGSEKNIFVVSITIQYENIKLEIELNYYDTPIKVQNRVDYKTKVDFYIGFYGALRLTKYYTLEPEIEYSAQGSKYKILNNKAIDLEVTYLMFKMINKCTFSDQFNVHLGPKLEFVVSNNFNTADEVDLAFVLGAGFNFTPNFGLELKPEPKRNCSCLNNDSNYTNVIFKLGATYTFDLK